MIVKYFLPQLHKLSMLQESKTYVICSVAVHCQGYNLLINFIPGN